MRGLDGSVEIKPGGWEGQNTYQWTTPHGKEGRFPISSLLSARARSCRGRTMRGISKELLLQPRGWLEGPRLGVYRGMRVGGLESGGGWEGANGFNDSGRQ